MAKDKQAVKEYRFNFFCRDCRQKSESDFFVERCECGSANITINDTHKISSYVLPMDKDRKK